MILLTIFILLIEALFFYIPLKEIKDVKTRKDKIKLYIGIFFSNIFSTLISGNSIFKYILYPLIVTIILKLLKLNAKFYDFFLFSIEMFIKTIIEYIIFLILFYYLDYFYFVIILETISIITIFLLKVKIKYLYNRIQNLLESRFNFYCRYSLLILFNLLIIILLYNLIQKAGVS